MQTIVGYPRGRQMTTGRERAAVAAYQLLQGMGAAVRVLHRLPNGIGYISPETERMHGPHRRPTCADCGRPISFLPSGWWRHDGLPDGCWRLSMDGPEPDWYLDSPDNE